jgi:hypothetical protein
MFDLDLMASLAKDSSSSDDLEPQLANNIKKIRYFMLPPVDTFVTHFEYQEKIPAQIWQFEDYFYLEVNGHLFMIPLAKHSINCPCYFKPKETQ